MKKTIIAMTLLLGGLTLSSCDLDEPTYGQTTNGNFYKTQTEVLGALTGAYLQLRTTWNEYALDFYLVGDCTTDDALKGGGSDGDRAEVQELSNFTTNSTNGEVGRRWEILYRLVNRCNEVIHYAPNAQGDATTLTRYANEAKALRAFAYYELVTTFGGVPLLTEPMTPEQILATPRATADSVWAQIIRDCTDAEALLAKGQYSSDEQYHVTRGFAKAMLAKSYMFRQDYANAEKVLHEIVDVDKDYSLLLDYGLNWTPAYENSSESVFEIPNKMDPNNPTLGTGTNVPHYFTSRTDAQYQGYGFHVPSADLHSAFDADDPRQTYVFTQTGDHYIGDAFDQDNSQSATGYNDYKMTVPQVEKQGYDCWMIPYNIRIIRYSDILLLYAEALNENGKSSEALTYLNMVRRRARNTSPMDPRKDKQTYIPVVTATTLPDITTTNKDELRKIIWHERRVELAMEGWRRDDLMRQRRFGQTMREYGKKYNVEKGSKFDDRRDYLFPIPQSEIDKSNGMLKQNPGY